MESPDNLPIKLFKNRKDWVDWLEKNHTKAPGIWMRIAKKGAQITSISYQEALEAALCYGWIDGRKNRCDESSWLQKFTSRGPKSIWSKINREKAEKLIRSGSMNPAGLKAVEGAKLDGRWNAAYDSPRSATVPEDFQAELDKNERAKIFFLTLNSANRYAILFRINTAKRAETRQRRIQQLIRMLENGQKIHPDRPSKSVIQE
jgi:uncharacterized protein YdeI (YjbR/CyaY-like superfamily)